MIVSLHSSSSVVNVRTIHHLQGILTHLRRRAIEIAAILQHNNEIVLKFPNALIMMYSLFSNRPQVHRLLYNTQVALCEIRVRLKDWGMKDTVIILVCHNLEHSFADRSDLLYVDFGPCLELNFLHGSCFRFLCLTALRRSYHTQQGLEMRLGKTQYANVNNMLTLTLAFLPRLAGWTIVFLKIFVLFLKIGWQFGI